ncbi:hypothetical protein VNI00_010773 [Paramarasmius palmivorus]|uniref:Uncharacterized protein n=1 Tax=Paramarasmius palmivorus TaxID=297713 RepID=A0AAW0CDJ2_9AGAR
MSSATPYRDYFRCRTIGRAASPPTWACYEQIPYDDEYSDSCSDSCSEDDEDYGGCAVADEGDSDSGDEHVTSMRDRAVDNAGDDIDMDMDHEVDEAAAKKPSEPAIDVKGKQKAIEPEPEPELTNRHSRRRQRRIVRPLRPILTIQRSQGFVWNQDLFIPPYIKDRYVASSPPNSSGFVSTSVSSTNSALTDYEVDVVEIRVTEGDLDHIIP